MIIRLAEILVPFLGPLRCILAGISRIGCQLYRLTTNQVLYPLKCHRTGHHFHLKHLSFDSYIIVHISGSLVDIFMQHPGQNYQIHFKNID